ncbi:SMP-30/gluconolactonase/LRE family protein [Rugamonas sp. FT82W]|uniref:SMP-30/gluconolactonase/LRE family protein n=2 Tax=Duganella vulcania TaxID=2692166 RepID=A0A845GBZ7_9BURK|nr:SMP-30/gluconolactonase/LRE family protein [Duganella vulcania]
MLAALIAAAYLSLWPVPIVPVSWDAPAPPGYTGVHAVNQRLTGLRQIALGGETGPEHVLAGPDGKLYTGVASGKILRMQPDGSALETYADTGGRPLGLDFDAAGNLIVADAVKGLLSVAPDRGVRVLADHVGGDAIRFADGVAVAANGKIYFSDASQRFAPVRRDTMEAAMLDVLEQSSTGRVLEYDPASRATRVLAGGLSFANGVLLSADQRWLYVSESGKYRVWKIAVDAAGLDVRVASPQAQVLLDNLPGYPDNLVRGAGGRIWLGLSGQRNDLDKMAGKPWLRKLMLRVPRALWPEPKPYGHVVAFTEDGRIVADLQDPGGAAPVTTGVTEAAGRLYIHNVTAGSLGWMNAEK